MGLVLPLLHPPASNVARVPLGGDGHEDVRKGLEGGGGVVGELRAGGTLTVASGIPPIRVPFGRHALVHVTTVGSLGGQDHAVVAAAIGGGGTHGADVAVRIILETGIVVLQRDLPALEGIVDGNAGEWHDFPDVLDDERVVRVAVIGVRRSLIEPESLEVGFLGVEFRVRPDDLLGVRRLELRLAVGVVRESAIGVFHEFHPLAGRGGARTVGEVTAVNQPVFGGFDVYGGAVVPIPVHVGEGSAKGTAIRIAKVGAVHVLGLHRRPVQLEAAQFLVRAGVGVGVIPRASLPSLELGRTLSGHVADNVDIMRFEGIGNLAENVALRHGAVPEEIL
mmetsp:Transcript_26834/g.79300  ORF Transcript_26834/g.79300 Transcript_26834/m.79300 type:complete len:336 (-) Transcript_26834:2480-3487(-)